MAMNLWSASAEFFPDTDASDKVLSVNGKPNRYLFVHGFSVTQRGAQNSSEVYIEIVDAPGGSEVVLHRRLIRQTATIGTNKNQAFVLGLKVRIGNSVALRCSDPGAGSILCNLWGSCQEHPPLSST